MSPSHYTTAAQPLIHDLEESILDLCVERIRPSFLAAGAEHGPPFRAYRHGKADDPSSNL
ncbi:unnamed protein product [Penicillium pancosmium]